MPAGFNEYIERARKLPANSDIAERYFSYLSIRESPSERSRLSYCNGIIKFLETIDKKAQFLSIEDIEDFKQRKRRELSDSRINDILSYVAKLVTYCESIGIAVAINEQTIRDLRIPVQDVKEKNPPKVLSPKDIVSIRKALIDNREYRKLISVELLYGFGLKEKDLSSFTLESYNKSEGTFQCKERVIMLPVYLQEIIKSTPEREFEKYSTYGGKEVESFKHHIIVAGELSKVQPLKISDFSKTHEETSIRCTGPKCNSMYKYPLEDQYWVLQEIECTEGINFYFPICIQCGKGLEFNE
jgi:hypothetical protein